MKNIICSIILSISMVYAFAQSTNVINKIKTANSQIKTLTCSFKQVKTMKMMNKEIASEGELYFQHADKMSMWYSEPKGNLLLINGDMFVMINGTKRNNFNMKQNSPMKQLRNTLLYSMSGDVKQTAEVNEVEPVFSETSQHYIFTMENKHKPLMNKLVLKYNKQTLLLDEMQLFEGNGNYTTYSMHNYKKNVAIENEKFALPK